MSARGGLATTATTRDVVAMVEWWKGQTPQQHEGQRANGQRAAPYLVLPFQKGRIIAFFLAI